MFPYRSLHVSFTVSFEVNKLSKRNGENHEILLVIRLPMFLYMLRTRALAQLFGLKTKLRSPPHTPRSNGYGTVAHEP